MYNIIIVGGGISGLYSAYMVLKKYPNSNILILEKNDYIGGRVGSNSFHNHEVSIGAGWGRKDKDHLLINLIKELNVPYNEVYMEHLYSNNFRRTCYASDVFSFLKGNFKYDIHSDKSFKNFSLPLLGVDDYNHFIACAGHTDFENQDVNDVLYNYSFEDNFDPWIGLDISWNQLIQNLSKSIGYEKIKLSTEVISLNTINSNFILQTNKESYLSQQVILATTIGSVRTLLPNFNIYDNIKCQPFLRVYGKFTPTSKKIIAETVPKMVNLNSHIHKMGPVNIDDGIYMIIYTDNSGALFFKNYIKDTLENRNFISRYIEQSLGLQHMSIHLEEILSYYWECGTHYFQPLPKEFLSRKNFIIQAQNPTNNLFVVGEMISMHQGWIEGALESVESIFN